MIIKTAQRNQGSALLITLGTLLVISIALTGYLGLVSNQNKAVTRAQAWNYAMPIAESGVEEALTQIQLSSGSLTSNGWTFGADGLYHKNRTFNDGSYFSVSITPSNAPMIISTGYVAAVYSSTNSANYVSRRVRINTWPTAAGLKAKGQITMGGNVVIDSFNSADPYHSTNGLYNPATREANAKVLSDSNMSGAISVGNAQIYGYAVTGPSGTVTVGSQGSVGELGWAAGNGIEPGHSANDANVQMDDVPTPANFPLGVPPLPGLVNGTNYDYVLNGGISTNLVFSLPGGTTIKGYMLVTGSAALYVNGTFGTGGNGYIYVAPGASLSMYLAGDATFSGGGLANGTGVAGKVSIYGLTSCSNVAYGGGAGFVGVLYAPDAAFSYKGNSDACGAFSAASMKFTGTANVHVDESVVGNGKVVKSWNEF